MRRRKHKNDNWFCPVCLIPVYPRCSGLGTAHYAGKNVLHDRHCDHYSPPTDGDGRGKPKPSPKEAIPPFFPTHLGEPQRIGRRPFFPPSEAQLRQLIDNAAPTPVGGTLEEVVDAWSEMLLDDRCEHPLTVGGVLSNYSDAFRQIVHEGEIPNNWGSVIAYYETNCRAGKVANHFFLNSVENLETQNGLSTVHMMLVSRWFQQEKAYIAALLRGAENLLVFWNGGEPRFEPTNWGSEQLQLLPHGQKPLPDQLALRMVL